MDQVKLFFEFAYPARIFLATSAMVVACLQHDSKFGTSETSKLNRGFSITLRPFLKGGLG